MVGGKCAEHIQEIRARVEQISEGERVERISDVKYLSSRCRACVGQVTCTCSTPARHLLKIWPTPARHKLDTCSTTARHVLDTCSTLARHLLNSHSTLAPLFLNMEMCWAGDAVDTLLACFRGLHDICSTCLLGICCTSVSLLDISQHIC